MDKKIKLSLYLGVIASVGGVLVNDRPSVEANESFETPKIVAEVKIPTTFVSSASLDNADAIVNVQYAPNAQGQNAPLRRILGAAIGAPRDRQQNVDQQSRSTAKNSPAAPAYAANAVQEAPQAAEQAQDAPTAEPEPEIVLDAAANEAVKEELPEGTAQESENAGEASNAAAPEASAEPQEALPEIDAVPVANTPEEREEIVREATEAQSSENDAESKSLALQNENPNAPDAPVQIEGEQPAEPSTEETPEQAAPAQEAPASEAAAPEQAPAATPTPAVEAPVERPRRALGFPGSEQATRDMVDDLFKNLNEHNGAQLYAQWRKYNASIRQRTNGLQTGNELNSRCRLRWYEKMYQDPIASVVEVERVSRALGQHFMGANEDVITGMRLARILSDVPPRLDRQKPAPAKDVVAALETFKTALVECASLHAKAIAPMDQKDIAAVMNESHAIFCSQVQSGHTVNSRGRAQYLIDAMEKMNKNALYEAGEALLSALDEETLAHLAELDLSKIENAKLSSGETVGLIHTEAGDIIIGGPEDNVWDLDMLAKVCCVIDLGGNDLYKEGSCILNRPILMIVDLGKGNDRYVGKNVAIQGGALLGVSVWYDDGGDDRYVAKDVCQGSAIGGFGVLINNSGDDKYLGFLRSQGTALCGFGLCLDRAGNDDYRGALFAQGFGAPGGFGALVDVDGKDHYYVGGYYFDSYPEHPGYDGWGQGVGAGIRRVACGGIGALLDGGGDDAYEYDYFAHGGGYWMGIGFARDFGGNDIRYAATSTMYDGSRRREQRWQRFGAGFGCHYACGYLFDDAGDDVYGGTIMGVGMGWDLGAGFLVDFTGNDAFEATGGLTCGSGGEGSIGAILNYRGDDTYNGNSQGYASGQLSYHSPSNCGANFSFVIDHGGKDAYGGYDNYRRPVQNNAITQRGGVTGLIVDRPSPAEEKAASDKAELAKEVKPIEPQGAQKAQQAQRPAPKTSQGYPTQESQIKTMVAPPPLYDTNPHPTSSGTNAFNPQPTSDFGAGQSGGFRPFGGFFGR